MNGGIGFSVEAPKAQLTISATQRTEICDHRLTPMGSDEQEQLADAVGRFVKEHNIPGGVRIELTGALRTHMGMGSSTALRLAAIEGLARLNSLPITRDALVRASGRGGTSGIGINSYFEGGMVCDLGRAADGQHFAPSSVARSIALPLALPVVKMPDWPILLCIPRAIAPKSQAEEIDFFSRTAPLSPLASFRACYIALFGLYAAAQEKNYVAFCEALDRMQGTEWKRAERAEYGNVLDHIATELRRQGADCVGMSSLGPMLFCFAPKQRMSSLEATAHALECDTYSTVPANQGREVGFNDA